MLSGLPPRTGTCPFCEALQADGQVVIQGKVRHTFPHDIYHPVCPLRAHEDSEVIDRCSGSKKRGPKGTKKKPKSIEFTAADMEAEMDKQSAEPAQKARLPDAEDNVEEDIGSSKLGQHPMEQSTDDVPPQTPLVTSTPINQPGGAVLEAGCTWGTKCRDTLGIPGNVGDVAKVRNTKMVKLRLLEPIAVATPWGPLAREHAMEWMVEERIYMRLEIIGW